MKINAANSVTSVSAASVHLTVPNKAKQNLRLARGANTHVIHFPY